MTGERPAGVRVATADDAALVADLESRCLGEDAWSSTLVDELVTGTLPTVTCLVAPAPGAEAPALAGHAVISCVADIAELQRIAVLPEHRRAGTGTALLEAALDLAGRTGADRLLLEVRATNKGALSFYAEHGFSEIDRRARYYSDGETAVVLRRGLGRGCGGRG